MLRLNEKQVLDKKIRKKNSLVNEFKFQSGNGILMDNIVYNIDKNSKCTPEKKKRIMLFFFSWNKLTYKGSSSIVISAVPWWETEIRIIFLVRVIDIYLNKVTR